MSEVTLNPLECALDEAQAFRRQADALKAENAKLRELMADAWGYINHPADVSWTHMRRKEARDSLSDRMCELGVEVP